VKRFLLLFSLLLMVACGPAAEPEVVEETAVADNATLTLNEEAAGEVVDAAPTATVEAAVEPEPTDEPEIDTPQPAVEEDTSTPQIETAFADFIPAASVAAAAQLRSQDWTIGAETPRLTIIEYGDFQ